MGHLSHLRLHWRYRIAVIALVIVWMLIVGHPKYIHPRVLIPWWLCNLTATYLLAEKLHRPLLTLTALLPIAPALLAFLPEATVRARKSPVVPAATELVTPLREKIPEESRVVVGECQTCHGPLWAARSALRLKMPVRCSCGCVTMVESFGKCTNCRRIIPQAEAHIRVSYYDMEEYTDYYCPRCFIEKQLDRGRLVDRMGEPVRWR